MKTPKPFCQTSHKALHHHIRTISDSMNAFEHEFSIKKARSIGRVISIHFMWHRIAASGVVAAWPNQISEQGVMYVYQSCALLSESM